MFPSALVPCLIFYLGHLVGLCALSLGFEFQPERL
jgi:hypothetical protein